MTDKLGSNDRRSPSNARKRIALFLVIFLGLGIAGTGIAWRHVLHREGDLDQAAAHYERAVRQDPEFVTGLLALAALRVARPSAEPEAVSEAIELAEKACDLTKHGDPNALEILSRLYAKAGRFDDAIATAEKALEIAHRTKDEFLGSRIEKNLKAFVRLAGERQ